VRDDDELLERTLAFSGSYVSDDGHLTVRRVPAGSSEYSGNQFVGYCSRCVVARLLASDGEALPDMGAVIAFVATHDHGDAD
jgi:hypothetical protein